MIIITVIIIDLEECPVDDDDKAEDECNRLESNRKTVSNWSGADKNHVIACLVTFISVSRKRCSRETESWEMR